MRLLTAILSPALLGILLGPSISLSQEAMIESSTAPAAIRQAGFASLAGSDCNQCGNSACGSYDCGSTCRHQLSWLHDVKVGYDGGFVIASKRERDLKTSNYPFKLKFNGWGQLRHTASDLEGSNPNLNQMQLKRGRLAFSGSAFNPNFSYFIQLDGRSSSGDDIRLLDYFLSYDIGNDQFGLDKGVLGFRTGKYKMPFTMARWLSGQQLEFTDRSVASMFFDVNRSFGVGLYGETKRLGCPIQWETAIFNGLVTGGAETGSSGTLDDNFAYSARMFVFPIGNWGKGSLADLDGHDCLAMRLGCGFASSKIDRSGTTEFNTLRVVDSGDTLASLLALLPDQVSSYFVSIYSIDTSIKYRGWSSTLEYYFRNTTQFRGAAVPNLHDHGFWLQLGYFVVPNKLELLSRWSRVVGNSGTLGVNDQSSDELAAAFAWYFRDNHAKLVVDVTHLDGAPINAASLDISPGDRGWLFRSQVQFSF